MEQARREWGFAKILRLFERKEVKTPLSFAFRVVLVLPLVWALVLYAPVSESLKVAIFHLVTFVVAGVLLAVLIFAWFRPKHLVYGESAHRAETKLEFGTEARIINQVELDMLPKEENPKQLPEGKQ